MDYKTLASATKIKVVATIGSLIDPRKETVTVGDVLKIIQNILDQNAIIDEYAIPGSLGRRRTF